METVFESKLEKLINSKQFEELSAKEKEYVLQKISIKDYSNFHEIICSSNQIFSEEFEQVEPELKVKQNLTQAFRNKHQKPLFNFLSFDFPSFKTTIFKPVLAIGVVILLIFIYYPTPKNQKLISQTKKIEKEIENSIVKKAITKPLQIQQNSKPVITIESDNSSINKSISDEEFFNSTINLSTYKDETICLTTVIDENEDVNNYLSDSEFHKYTTVITPDSYFPMMSENPIKMK